jgi:integrase
LEEQKFYSSSVRPGERKERNRKEKCMPYIRRLKSGKYCFQIHKKGFPRLSKTFIDKISGRRWAREIELQMDKNIFEDYSGAAGTTLKSLLIKYRDEITSKKRGFREETSKINYLIRHKIALNSLMRLRSSHIYKLKTELSATRAAATVNKYIHLLSHTWSTARKVWSISLPMQNPFELVSLDSEPPPRDRVLTSTEYQKLLDACSLSNLPWLRDLVEFAYLTGARQGEILKLKREDINFEKRVCTFYKTKNGLDRTIPLSDVAISILKKYRFGPLVFNVLKRRLRKHFDIAKKRAGIENFRYHDLRACFCTNALLSGWTIAQTAAVSGHQDWSQLKIYSRIKAEDLVDKINTINVVNLK